LRTGTVLFIGYSVADPDFRRLLARIAQEAGRGARNLFTLTFNLTELESRELEARGIRPISLGDSEDRTRLVAGWLETLADEIASARDKIEVIHGKTARNERLVAEARRVMTDRSPRQPIRTRQGFGPLSFDDLEYPEDPEYSELLRHERDTFFELLRTGVETRMIVTRRPSFSSDLTTTASEDLALASRMVRRCQRLIAVLDDLIHRPEPMPLLIAYSPTARFAEVAFGTKVLLRGTRSDSSSGYTITTVHRNRADLDRYCAEFDREFGQLTQGAFDGAYGCVEIVRAASQVQAHLLATLADLTARQHDLSDGSRQSPL
jgi:hypothetical protein